MLELVIQRARMGRKVLRVGALKGSRSNDFYMRHGFKLASQGEWDNYYALQPDEA